VALCAIHVCLGVPTTPIQQHRLKQGCEFVPLVVSKNHQKPPTTLVVFGNCSGIHIIFSFGVAQITHFTYNWVE